MMKRYCDVIVVAVDENQQLHLVSTECSHTDSCGYYYNRVENGKKVYECDTYIDDDTSEAESKPPYICVSDCVSYFSKEPTNDMTIVLENAGLVDVNISLLMLLCVNRINNVFWNAELFSVSKDGVEEEWYDLYQTPLGNSAEEIVTNILALHNISNCFGGWTTCSPVHST